MQDLTRIVVDALALYQLHKATNGKETTMARPKNETPRTRVTVMVPQDVFEKMEDVRWNARLTTPEFVVAAIKAHAEKFDTPAAK